MAYVTTGFSLPYVAKYSNPSGTNVFADGIKLARGVSVSVDADTVDGLEGLGLRYFNFLGV